MQTFLPYPSFHSSAKVLDWRRLGKQRIEAKQIATILLGENKSPAYSKHPAVLMWKGCTQALLWYGRTMCMEWSSRGYVDNTCQFFETRINSTLTDELMPDWFGDEEFHASHRAALLRKNPDYYEQFGWTETPIIKYVWPRS